MRYRQQPFYLFRFEGTSLLSLPINTAPFIFFSLLYIGYVFKRSVVLVLGLKISLVVVVPVFSVCQVGQFLQARANLCFVKKHFFPMGHPVKNSFAALFIFNTLNSASNTIIGSVIALKIESSFSLLLYILA